MWSALDHEPLLYFSILVLPIILFQVHLGFIYAKESSSRTEFVLYIRIWCSHYVCYHWFWPCCKSSVLTIVKTFLNCRLVNVVATCFWLGWMLWILHFGKNSAKIHLFCCPILLSSNWKFHWKCCCNTSVKPLSWKSTLRSHCNCFISSPLWWCTEAKLQTLCHSPNTDCK